MNLGFVGGTGPAGIGLAARFARAGLDVSVGSRVVDRAEAARARVLELAPGVSAGAAENRDVVRDADMVFLTVPPEAQRATVEQLAPDLAGRIVVSMSNPLRVESGRVFFEPPAAGSLAEEVAEVAPSARVVGAFHEIRVSKFAKVERAIESDTVVTADDDEAKRIVMDLAATIEGIRPVDGGALSNSRHVEAFVAVLITINFRYKAAASYRITGLP